MSEKRGKDLSKGLESSKDMPIFYMKGLAREREQLHLFVCFLLGSCSGNNESLFLRGGHRRFRGQITITLYEIVSRLSRPDACFLSSGLKLPTSAPDMITPPPLARFHRNRVFFQYIFPLGDLFNLTSYFILSFHCFDWYYAPYWES